LEEEAEKAIAELLATPELRDVVEEVLGPDWVVVTNRHHHIVIDRGCGSRANRIHRDLLHWSRDPLTLLVMLDCDEHDQLAWPSVLPGSHLWPVKGPANGGGYWLDEQPERDLAQQAVKVPMAPGDVLVMDGMTYHAAGVGRSDQPRVMATLCLRTPDELTGRIAANEELAAGAVRYEGQARWPHG
jgi:ectoine hydroxylase-related dioxygenase (phytanoyl-CoA dioxygenase family)